MSRTQQIILAGLVAVFTAWHLPLMFRVAAGQDEDFYAVPGITILRTGLPQIPYIPSRDPDTVYFHADEILYTLPPLHFYIQAFFHWIIGPGLGAARVASLAAGLITVGIVFDLARSGLADSRAGLFAAGFYLFSRAFYFPATMARPDITATMFGVLAVWCASCRPGRRPLRPIVAAGAAAGASLLCHPLGLVPTCQVALWLLVRPGDPRQRLRHTAAFSACALAVLALWTPLLLLHPEWVEVQFVRNILLRRAGPNAGMAVQSPWALVAYQATCLWECFNPIQSSVYLLGLLWAVLRWQWRAPRGGELVFHIVASLVILLALLGRHSIRGYYAYPAAFASVAVGGLAAALTARLAALGVRRAAWVVGLVLAVLLVPGSGIRTVIAHARHADDQGYDAREFARWIMADIPESSLVAVDQPFVLDFYLKGGRVLDALIDPYYIDIRDFPFDHVVLGRNGLRRVLPLLNDIEPIRSYGDPADEFGNYAVLYRRRPR